MTLSPSHPLYSAQLRTRRAGQLIGTLRRQFWRWTHAQATDPTLKFTEISPGVFEVSRGDPPVEHLYRAAITIGEIAYNCRAALDYLVRELAKAENRGKEVRGTQFPIEDAESRFNGRVTGINPDDPDRPFPRYLHKVNPKAVEVFWSLQPFAGCEWTRLMRDISNPDKHRYVPMISSNENFLDATYDPDARSIKGVWSIKVVFEHERDIEVVNGIRVIHRETVKLINGFAPVFKPIAELRK